MQQILSVWNSLETRRRLVVVGATAIVFLAVLGLSRMASQPSLSLLYSGLEPGAAGDVVAALDQRGVTYEVREGAIFVDSTQRDLLRMTLAAEGLPANGAAGYELLDSLSGFGTTSQMFDAAYWRAKEGELARTISASPLVRAARVHISNPSSNPFQRNLKPTASVAISGASGAISPAQAKAFKFLVASAVAGLAPEDVSIIDGTGALVTSEDALAVSGNDRAGALKRNIQRILEARVGLGKAVVEVNVDTVTDREAIVERTFDPEGRVAISVDSEERSSTASGTDNDAVTVASNLPEGDAAGGESSNQSENTETRERVNYEVSETTREVLRTPGAVRRISVAVLVDGIRTEDPATGQTVWVPRSDEEIDALRELVASAVGFDADRGDSITIKSMEFQPFEVQGTAEAPSFLSQLTLNPMTLIQMGLLALVALILGLFVVRPILASAPVEAAAALPAPSGTRDTDADLSRAAVTEGEAPRSGALTGEIDDGAEPISSMSILGEDDDDELGDIMPVPGFQYEEEPVDRLRQLIQDRREETVEILRGWMSDEEVEEFRLMPPLTLEDFDLSCSLSGRGAIAPVADMPSADTSVVAATYEEGYQAGWDDAVKAQAEDRARIDAEFARNLRELSLTFHEARAHVIESMEALLGEMVGTLLPGLMAETFALTLREELRPLIAEAADAPIDLVVGPGGGATLEKAVGHFGSSAVRLREEPSLAEGQAYLRLGKIERQIDLSGALDQMRAALTALFELNERTLKDAGEQ